MQGKTPRRTSAQQKVRKDLKAVPTGIALEGNPDFKRMLACNYHRLTVGEQAFLEDLCGALLARAGYAIAESGEAPEALLAFMREKGFFGLIVRPGNTAASASRRWRARPSWPPASSARPSSCARRARLGRRQSRWTFFQRINSAAARNSHPCLPSRLPTSETG
jgi:hypothetical protein